MPGAGPRSGAGERLRASRPLLLALAVTSAVDLSCSLALFFDLSATYLALYAIRALLCCATLAGASAAARGEASRARPQPQAEREAALLREDEERPTSPSVGSQPLTEPSTREHGTMMRRKALNLVTFVTVTAQAVFTSLHAITLTSADSSLGVLLAATVVCMNAQFIMQRTLLERLTSPAGVLNTTIHDHELTFMDKQCMSFCNLCASRIGLETGGYKHYRCKTCEGEGKGAGKGKGGQGYVVCTRCFQKSLVRQGGVQEGILRGDLGPKSQQNLTNMEYWRRFYKLVTPFLIQFVIAVVCVFCTQIVQVFLPKYQGDIINSLIGADRGKFQTDLHFFIALSIVTSIFGSVQGLTAMTVSRLLVLRLRKQMFENLLVQDIALYDGIMVGQLTSRMTSDVAQLTQPISQFLTMFLSGMVQLTGATVMCIHTSWKLTLLAATMLGPVMYLTTVYATWSQGVNTLIMSAMGDCTAVATEALRNIRTVRSFGADQVERNTYNSNIDLCWKWMLKDSFASAGVTATTYCLSFATGVLIYWYGGNAILDGSDMQLNIGNLVTFNLYWQMMQTSVRQMNSMLSTLIVSASSGKRVFEIIDTSPDIPLDDPAALQLGHTLPDIVFENVKFTYQMRPDSLVFGSVSFSIPAGKTVALVGKSGAGKTTCVSLLLRFYDPQGGSILVGGHRLQELNLRAWQRRIGVVSQETQVFARSVRENLSYGLSSEEYSDASMEEAARAANIHDFILSMDQGYDSMLGEGGSRLSGGQKQRLAIARAILRGPQLLLLDEATSALDSENERQIQGAIDQMVERMQGNCSVVLIAHRLSTVINASKIIVLHEGCKLEEGTHDELLRNDKVYAKLVRKQLAKEQQELQQDKKDSDSEDEDGKGGKKGKKGKSKGSSAGTGLATEWQELRQDKKDRDNENGKMGKSKGYSAGTEVAKKEQHELQQDKTDNDSENGWKGKGKGSGAGTESTTEPQERQQEKKDSDGDGEDEKGKGGKNGKGSKKGKHKGSPPGAGKGKDEAEGGGSLW